MRVINAPSPDMLVRVLDTLPVRIFWKDRESRFLGCSRLFATDAGVADPSEFIGRSDFYFYHPDQAASFRDDDADVMHSRTPKLGIIEKLTKANGVVVWLETNKWPLFDALAKSSAFSECTGTSRKRSWRMTSVAALA